MLMEGWRDQFERMMRSHAELLRVIAGSENGSAAARDVLYHFVQDANHLKDWLRSDSTSGVGSVEVERLVESIDALRDCRDLCNATKHFRDRGTAFVSQSVRVDVGAGTVAHAWTYESSNGERRDALDLADDVVREWKEWLAGKGLI